MPEEKKSEKNNAVKDEELDKKKIEERTQQAKPPVVASARGFEGEEDQSDIIIPRAKLIQSNSPELQENIKGLKVGKFINSLTKEILPEVFIPIFRFKNWMRFNPRKVDDPGYDPTVSKGALIWRSSDPNDERVIMESKFGNNNEKPLATTFLNFFSWFPGHSMPVIVSFSNTSYKSGKQLLSMAKFCGGDLFSRKYKLSSEIHSNESGTFSVIKTSACGEVDPDTFKLCEKLWQDYSPKKDSLKVDEEHSEEHPYS